MATSPRRPITFTPRSTALSNVWQKCHELILLRYKLDSDTLTQCFVACVDRMGAQRICGHSVSESYALLIPLCQIYCQTLAYGKSYSINAFEDEY